MALRHHTATARSPDDDGLAVKVKDSRAPGKAKPKGLGTLGFGWGMAGIVCLVAAFRRPVIPSFPDAVKFGRERV